MAPPMLLSPMTLPFRSSILRIGLSALTAKIRVK